MGVPFGNITYETTQSLIRETALGISLATDLSPGHLDSGTMRAVVVAMYCRSEEYAD